MSVRHGARLGIDVGTVRIGVARSDVHAILATPLSTVPRDDDALEHLVAMIKDIDAIEIIVGLPLALSGASTASTQDAVGFAEKLSAATDIPVRLLDERLTTVSAQSALHTTGKNTKSSRPVIDQVAATIILQHALDVEHSSGNPPGELIAKDKG